VSTNSTTPAKNANYTQKNISFFLIEAFS